MSKATNEKRWARAALSMWALGICAFLGIFLFVAVDGAFEMNLVHGYEPLLGALFWSWVLLMALRVFAFWMVRRATGAADPFLIAIISLVPVLSLVVNTMIVQQAARDLGDRGHATDIATVNLWAWVLPYVVAVISWLTQVALVAMDSSGVHSLAIFFSIVAFFIGPALLRLRIALKLRSAIHAWQLSTTTASPRAHGSSPAAG